MGVEGLNFKKLTPKKDIELGMYEEALDYIFDSKNSDIRNIAISGNYGSGKTSLIETYKEKTKESERKYISISLAHFKSEEKNEDKKMN